VREKATIRNLKSCALDDRGTGAGAAFVSIPDEGGQQRYAAHRYEMTWRVEGLAEPDPGEMGRVSALGAAARPRCMPLRAVCATAQIQGMTPSPGYCERPAKRRE
jgi:hypothetical protein